MRSNYKILGNYIREVNNRNSLLEDVELLGVSIQKVFIPSIANIIGTNMSTYKLIKKGQFAYGPVTSRNGDKISIALLEDRKQAMISQAYISFEIVNCSQLLPGYLMMWFRRPEFDRYARFMSHGSAREIFGWQEMCNLRLPIPSIEVQKEIVREYEVLNNKIKVNQQLIRKIEETLQSIYKQWFINFEFPNENALPYKLNGGEMEFSEELDKEIPTGWEVGTLGSISHVITGFSFKGEDYSFDTGISVLRGENVTEQRTRWDTHKKWDKPLNGLEQYFLKENDIVVGMDGSKVGKNWSLISQYELPLLLAQRVACIRTYLPNHQLFLYYSFIVLSFEDYVSQVQTGTSIPHISKNQILEFPILIPSKDTMELFNSVAIKLVNHATTINYQNDKLSELKNLLMGKMASIKEVAL